MNAASLCSSAKIWESQTRSSNNICVLARREHLETSNSKHPLSSDRSTCLMTATTLVATSSRDSQSITATFEDVLVSPLTDFARVVARKDNKKDVSVPISWRPTDLPDSVNVNATPWTASSRTDLRGPRDSRSSARPSLAIDTCSCSIQEPLSRDPTAMLSEATRNPMVVECEITSNLACEGV